MLGLRILSDLAHRLEDAFQVLKNRKINSAIDADLHNLLLSSVDWLHHILELVNSNYLIDEHWLITFCYPLFEELYQRLGKPELEESNSEFTHIPNPENIIHFLFQTEVEKNLQSLYAFFICIKAPDLYSVKAFAASSQFHAQNSGISIVGIFILIITCKPILPKLRSRIMSLFTNLWKGKIS